MKNRFNGPNSLSASGTVAEPSKWEKALGYASGLTDLGEQDLGQLYNDVDFDDPANDELLGVIADTETEIAAAKPESQFAKRFGSVLVDLGKDISAQSTAPKVSAPAFKATFRPQQVSSYGQQAMGEMDMAGALNMNPFGF
ncbi:MAG: hypothetical protein ACRDCE_22770 [Cetobacterium sp.]|uniref:hypothetical protein n=1 Tax=Cetobacterium sp. TaxID=2071632 RepID=UPI003EE4EFF1